MENESNFTLSILRKTSAEILKKYITALNDVGYITDETDMISSVMIENWNKDCTDFLKENNFFGEKLLSYGKYYPQYGAVYALYNPDTIDYETGNKENVLYNAKKEFQS